MAIYSWITHWKCWFSIAMLVYQRLLSLLLLVNIQLYHHPLSHCISHYYPIDFPILVVSHITTVRLTGNWWDNGSNSVPRNRSCQGPKNKAHCGRFWNLSWAPWMGYVVTGFIHIFIYTYTYNDWTYNDLHGFTVIYHDPIYLSIYIYTLNWIYKDLQHLMYGSLTAYRLGCTPKWVLKIHYSLKFIQGPCHCQKTESHADTSMFRKG
jgi:hypothetical protein